MSGHPITGPRDAHGPDSDAQPRAPKTAPHATNQSSRKATPAGYSAAHAALKPKTQAKVDAPSVPALLSQGRMLLAQLDSVLQRRRGGMVAQLTAKATQEAVMAEIRKAHTAAYDPQARRRIHHNLTALAPRVRSVVHTDRGNRNVEADHAELGIKGAEMVGHVAEDGAAAAANVIAPGVGGAVAHGLISGGKTLANAALDGKKMSWGEAAYDAVTASAIAAISGGIKVPGYKLVEHALQKGEGYALGKAASTAKKIGR